MRQTLNRGPSGNGNPDWKPVSKEKESRKKITNSSRPEKGVGGARNIIQSAQLYLGEHQRYGVVCHSLASPSRQRATADLEEDEACSPAQVSAYAVTPSGPERDLDTGNTYIPSRSVPNAHNPCLPPHPAQARGTPTFLLAPNLAQVTCTSDNMAGVEATAPNPSIPGLFGIVLLLKAWSNTTPQARI